jgi:hypothetical protein
MRAARNNLRDMKKSALMMFAVSLLIAASVPP